MVIVRRTPLLAVLPAALLIAGCSSGDEDPAASPGSATTATTTVTTTTAAAPPSTRGAGGSGCPATGYALTGTNSAPTLDVDGDGQADTEWIATQPTGDGSVQFGVQTASGAAISANLASASPNARSVLVADVTGNGEFVVLASDGRAVQLWAISDCAIVPVQNPQGQQYTFDLGFTGHGTGVGCADVDGDGVRDLVGLEADGVTVTSTIVALDGPNASNGASTTISDVTPALADAARSVGCGDLTLADDGVTSGP